MSTSSERPNLLAWVDVESTGLDASKEHLLEVACLVTDTDLNLLDEEGFSATLWYSRDEASWMRSRADAVVRDMHDKTGLWDRLPEGRSHRRVETDMLAYIKRLAPEPRQARIAGNSVRLDMNFLEAKLPRVMSHLHYRFVDVSGLTFLADEWAGIAPFKKQYRHAAMDDIKESLAELAYLRARLGFGSTASRLNREG